VARYLIVNADDFGLTESVSRGILKAYRHGILTSTTFMVNFPWASEMATLLTDAPDLGVGIHLNLTTGTPVLPPEQVPSLVTKEGRFTKEWLHLRFRVDLAHVKKEWSAQVEKGIRLLGRPPSHLDTHRYLQGAPAYAAVMIDVAHAYGIPAVRCLYPGMFPPDTFRRWSPAGLLVGRYLQQSAAVVARSGLRRPDVTMAGDFTLRGLLEKLAHVGEGITEIVTHPGEVDDHLRSLTSLVEQREVELGALTAPEARATLEAHGIMLTSFAHAFGKEGDR
jgi:predicted glycoside hydrolase/deacetylase ChbG (UPF0249 family)